MMTPPLPEDANLFRTFGNFAFRVTVFSVTPEIWDDVRSLPEHFLPPVWDTLRLDARQALPAVGTAIVLAASSLEIFISQVLDALAPRSSIPNEVWNWLNERNLRQANPSTDEQLDFLLKAFTGHSLKEEDQTLWETYKNLKKARNSFVHEGSASLGPGKQTISAEDAKKLIAGVDAIIQTVRQWLPHDLHWPEFKRDVQTRFQLPMPGTTSTPPKEPAPIVAQQTEEIAKDAAQS